MNLDRRGFLKAFGSALACSAVVPVSVIANALTRADPVSQWLRYVSGRQWSDEGIMIDFVTNEAIVNGKLMKATDAINIGSGVMTDRGLFVVGGGI